MGFGMSDFYPRTPGNMIQRDGVFVRTPATNSYYAQGNAGSLPGSVPAWVGGRSTYTSGGSNVGTTGGFVDAAARVPVFSNLVEGHVYVVRAEGQRVARGDIVDVPMKLQRAGDDVLITVGSRTVSVPVSFPSFQPMEVYFPQLCGHKMRLTLNAWSMVGTASPLYRKLQLIGPGGAAYGIPLNDLP